jgi:phosphoribosylformylglycinamidine cyclo-ligase
LSEIGSFGGLFRPDLEGLQEPLLVASADGVGTKLAVARQKGDFSTVGRDLVNHCVNDILVQGARPLFFLDYIGAGKLVPEKMAELVQGLSLACRENHCALLGGETAEMPGFYDVGDYELVGFIVGMVDRACLLPREVRPGGVLLGLPSSGLHTNGYSLARKVLFEEMGLALEDALPDSVDSCSVGEILLEPHLTYLPVLGPLLGDQRLRALAHITGGGLTDNLPRVLPNGLQARIEVGRWRVPEIFRVIQDHGRVRSEEMRRVFNLGIGMVAIVEPAAADEILGQLTRSGCAAAQIGEIEAGENGVIYQEEA